MLMVINEEVFLSIHTDCGLPLRKLRIKLHRDEQRPHSLRLMISLADITVLNGELE